MINRICISITSKCNLSCSYCHFREKRAMASDKMNVFEILDNVKRYAKETFKIGFVGDGEAFLELPRLKSYLSYIEDNSLIQAYTITNGTIGLTKKDWIFLEDHRVNVGFSIDGYKELHDSYRCNSFDIAMNNVEAYRMATGHYPTFNATIGKESIEHSQQVIDFFKPFGTRVTFSRMIGKNGITLDAYRRFLTQAEKELSVRRGGLDCTMYGGKCGAGINNFFFADGNVYYCGNCVDLPPVGPSNTPFEELEKIQLSFDRDKCFKESICV